MKLNKHILSVGFLVMLIFPLINYFVPLVSDIKSTENRRLKTFADIKFSSTDSLTKTTETVLVDQLSIRNRMQKVYNDLNVFVFRSSPISLGGFIGKDGWFFLSGEELKAYTGTSRFTVAELEIVKKEFEMRKKICEQNNAKLYIAIVPVKANVYPEFMPDHILRSNQSGMGEQVLKLLTDNGFNTIDLTSSLANNKSADIYFKTDNHWNDLGAYKATNEILKSMNKDFKNISTLKDIHYPITLKMQKGGNIAKIFSVENEVEEKNFIPTKTGGFESKVLNEKKYKVTEGFPYPEEYESTRVTKNDSLPTILLIRDSFGEKLFPYLSEKTKKCKAIYDGWQYGLNEEIIKSEKPDIVLYLILECNLRNIVKFSKLE